MATLSLLATPTELQTITDVDTAREFARTPQWVWDGFSLRLGGVSSLRILAMAPLQAWQSALVATRVQPPAVNGTQPPQRELTTVECTQLALMYRVSLQKFALPDVDPLAPVASASQGNAQQGNPVQNGATPQKGRKVKANTILDQGDDGEITLLSQDDVDKSYRQLREIKRGEPTLDSSFSW